MLPTLVYNSEPLKHLYELTNNTLRSLTSQLGLNRSGEPACQDAFGRRVSGRRILINPRVGVHTRYVAVKTISGYCSKSIPT